MALTSRSPRKMRTRTKQTLKKRVAKKRAAKKPASKPRAKRSSVHADTMVETALAVFAHEVRTPLTGILAVSDLLATSDLGERERRWVETIKAGAEHLAGLATLFVDAARQQHVQTGARCGRICSTCARLPAISATRWQAARAKGLLSPGRRSPTSCRVLWSVIPCGCARRSKT
jgi:signal transduction histidine kinase